MSCSNQKRAVDELFEKVDSFNVCSIEKLPKIGISANRRDGLSCIVQHYVDAVLKAGGAPVLIPVITDTVALASIVADLDGLVMSGGADMDPLLVGEEPIKELQDVDRVRDVYDFTLLRLAANRQLPIMGICRGHQVLNVAFGGTIYQDIYTQSTQRPIKHSQQQPRWQPSHRIQIENGSNILRTAFGEACDVVEVNSFHHQSVKDVAPEFVQTAMALDGLNEAVEHPFKPVFGVQWHPEAMASEGDEKMTALFEQHIEAAKLYAEAKRIHQKYVILDSHTDTPMIFPGQFDLSKKQGGKVNLPFMQEGYVDAVIMVAYIPQKERSATGYAKAKALTFDRLNEIKRQESINGSQMAIAYTPDDIDRIKREGKKAVLLGVENGYAIGKDLSMLDELKRLGVVYITLSHNGDNDICDSARGKGEWGGVSPFGKEVIAKMNDLGIMVDVSHVSEKSCYDAIKYSRVPVIASHSSARALCDHPRNLTDDQLRKIAETGGVVQVCLYKGFLNKESSKASVKDAVAHINHMVKIMGIDHVGIGSDFDGDGGIAGCQSSNELINLTMELLKEGYSEDDLAKLWGGNILRVMRQVQSAAKQII